MVRAKHPRLEGEHVRREESHGKLGRGIAVDESFVCSLWVIGGKMHELDRRIFACFESTSSGRSMRNASNPRCSGLHRSVFRSNGRLGFVQWRYDDAVGIREFPSNVGSSSPSFRNSKDARRNLFIRKKGETRE